MRVVFHPSFVIDHKEYEADYAEISFGLAQRFRAEIDGAITAIKASPTAAGHYLKAGIAAGTELRRRNLDAFPFFVLYGWSNDTLVLGSIIPTRSDPLNWLARFGGKK
jgi:hypothetical protein